MNIITLKPSHFKTPRLSRDCTFQGRYVTGKRSKAGPVVVVATGLIVSILASLEL